LIYCSDNEQQPGYKNLGDLSKIPSNALMLAILRAVDSQQAGQVYFYMTDRMKCGSHQNR
jgi:hypothetical protein